MKKISIVVPLYNEQDNVEELIRRVRKMADLASEYRFEFVVVDDGSSDNTLMILLELRQQDPRIKIVKLSRNWGFQSAYNAGLDNADGDAVVLMDGDLQDPPELIPQFIEMWEQGYDVVYSVKTSRKESIAKKMMISLFYRLIRRFSNVSIDRQSGMFSLLSRKAAGELRTFTEKNKFYVGLRSFIGFKQAVVNYERDSRYQGVARQSFFKLVNYALNAFFSFSFLPIRLLTYFGIVTLLFSFFAGVGLVIVSVLNVNILFINGNRSLLSLILLTLTFHSIVIIFLGIIGEYIARIFDEVRERPFYIVDSVYGQEFELQSHESLKSPLWPSARPANVNVLLR